MEEGEWWGRGREIFIKIEHRFLRSGLDLTLLSLPWPLFHSPVVDLQSSWEGGKEKTKKKNHTSPGKRPWRFSFKPTREREQLPIFK